MCFVHKFLDAITLCIDSQTSAVSDQLDYSLAQTTLPENIFTPIALAELKLRFSERLERHGLRY